MRNPRYPNERPAVHPFVDIPGKECERKKDLKLGRKIRSLLISNGLDEIAVFGDHLIRLFSYHECLFEANQAFYKIGKPSKHTYAAAIWAHVKSEQSEFIFELHHNLQAVGGLSNNKYICLAALKKCINSNAIFHGRTLHEQVLANELHTDLSVGNSLVDMYAKCGSLKEARETFNTLLNKDVITWNSLIAGCSRHGDIVSALECLDKMQHEGIIPNAVSWTAIIEGHVQHGNGLLALQCFEMMQQQNVMPDSVTFLSALKACACVHSTENGRLIHDKVIFSRFQSDVIVGSTLVDMYAKCGCMEEAFEMFGNMQNRNVVSWNVMISGYVQCGEGIFALHLFEKMQQESVKQDEVTFLSALKACANIGALQNGRIIHFEIIKSAFHFDLVLGSGLIDMYSKCGSLEEAYKVFLELRIQDVVTWGAIIAGYAHHGKVYFGLKCFVEMHEAGMRPNKVVFDSVLTACSHAGLVNEGHWYFKFMREYGIASTASHYTCIVDLLGRSGLLGEAECLLHAIDYMGLMSLLSACRMHGNAELGKRCFDRIVCLNSDCAIAYILMSNIYADVHMQEDPHKVQKVATNLINLQAGW